MEHKHKWEILSEYYPLTGSTLELDYPHRLEYCSCGNKRPKKLTEREAEELAERIGIITKEVITNVGGNKQAS